MFRSDLESALARANQLEQELAALQQRAEGAEGALRRLRPQLAAQQDELARLRERLGEPGAPSPSKWPRSKALVLGASALMAILGAGLGFHLSRSPRRLRASRAVRVPQTPLGAERISFSDYVRQVAAHCSVGSSGWLTRCEPPDLRAQLERAQERIGVQAALMSYCRLLKEPPGAVARLAANRIGSVYGRRVEAADEEVYRCLEGYLLGSPTPAGLGQVVYTWARLGALSGRQSHLFRTLERWPAAVRGQGYRGLWETARLQVLPTLERLARKELAPIAEKAVEAFSGLRADEERARVCPLLADIAQEREEPRLRALLAYRMALLCRGSQNERVVALAGAALDDPRPLDYWWSAALSAMAKSWARPSRAFRTRAFALLNRIVTDEKRSPTRRAQALDACYEIDPPGATVLARRYRSASARDLRRSAERVLAKRKAGTAL